MGYGVRGGCSWHMIKPGGGRYWSSDSWLDCVWNVMAHAQKPDFVFRPKRTSPFKSVGASVQSTAGSRGLRISGINAGYTMFRGSVKSTGYPLHSPVSASLPLPCVTVYHHISAGLYSNVTCVGCPLRSVGW